MSVRRGLGRALETARAGQLHITFTTRRKAALARSSALLRQPRPREKPEHDEKRRREGEPGQGVGEVIVGEFRGDRDEARVAVRPPASAGASSAR